MLKASWQDAFQTAAGQRKSPRTSRREWVCLRYLARLPGTGAFEWNQRHCPIDMDYSVKLARHPAAEVMAKAFGFWPIDRADRPPEERLTQNSRHIIIFKREQKGGNTRLMEECFITPFQN